MTSTPKRSRSSWTRIQLPAWVDVLLMVILTVTLTVILYLLVAFGGFPR